MNMIASLGESATFRNHPLIGSAHAHGENRNTFEAFVRGFIGDLEPVGAVEVTLAARAAGLAWRVNRAQGLETRILSKPEGDRGETALSTGLSSRYARNALEMVSRWEQGLERSMFKTLETLDKAQRLRRRRGLGDKTAEPTTEETYTSSSEPEKTASSIQFDGESPVINHSAETGAKR